MLPPVYAPPVVYVPEVVTGPVCLPPRRVFVPAPVVIAPRVVYRHPCYQPPVVTPYYGDRYHHYGYPGQQAVYRAPPGHAKRYTKEAHLS